MEITKIKDLTHYTTLLLDNGSEKAKIHIPDFNGGDILFSLADSEGVTTKAKEIQISFKRASN